MATLSATAQNVIVNNLGTTSITANVVNLKNASFASPGNMTVTSTTAGDANAVSYENSTVQWGKHGGGTYTITISNGIITNVV